MAMVSRKSFAGNRKDKICKIAPAQGSIYITYETNYQMLQTNT